MKAGAGRKPDQVLYPNDNVLAGKELRLRQQYFYVACSLRISCAASARNCWKLDGIALEAFIHLNETHPALGDRVDADLRIARE